MSFDLCKLLLRYSSHTARLLSIVRSLVKEGITLEETKAIVLYLQQESRKPAVQQRCIDVLQLLLALLIQKVRGILILPSQALGSWFVRQYRRLGAIQLVYTSIATRERECLYLDIKNHG